MKLNRNKLRKMILAEMKDLVQINPAGAPGMGAFQKGPRGYGTGKDYNDGNYVTNGVFNYYDYGIEFSIGIHDAWVQYNRALATGMMIQAPGSMRMPAGIQWIITNIIKDPDAQARGLAYSVARYLQHAIVDYNNYIAADGITTVTKLSKEMNVA
jgi:hypothetical protein